MTPHLTGRLLWLDLIRAVAAQLIVLHHLAFFGPISLQLSGPAPGLIEWFAEYARIAVQVFLVISGFLAAQGGLMRSSSSLAAAGSILGRRYLRLFIPFMVAVAGTCLASALARRWAGPVDWASPWPDGVALLAHLTGTFDYFGIEALTLGAWYVSIDFQLHLLMVSILWLSHRLTLSPAQASRLGWAVVLGLAVLSIGWVNRDPRWDVTPIYFFGSFALGLASGRLTDWSRAIPAGAGRSLGFEEWAALAVMAVAVMGLFVTPAIRPAVALITALALLALGRGAGERWDRQIMGRKGREGPLARFIGLCGRSAYSLFLFHGALAILMNALYLRFFEGELTAAVVGALIAWLGALPLSWLMYRMVEARIVGR